MKLPKILRCLAFVMSSLGNTQLQCMMEEAMSIEIDLEDALHYTEEKIKTLAQRIDCKSPKTLCNSVQKLITYNPSPLIPYAMVAALQRTGKSILQKHTHGRTCLHLACLHGKTACVQALLTAAKLFGNQMLVNLLFMQDCIDDTALHMASCEGHTDCAQVLFDNARSIGNETVQALLLSKNSQGNTALHYTCMGGFTDFAKAVLDAAFAKAVLDTAKRINNELLQAVLLNENDWCYTPLHWACLKGHTTCAQVLIDSAKQMGNEFLTLLLLKKNDAGNTAFNLASYHRQLYPTD